MPETPPAPTTLTPTPTPTPVPVPGWWYAAAAAGLLLGCLLLAVLSPGLRGRTMAVRAGWAAPRVAAALRTDPRLADVRVTPGPAGLRVAGTVATRHDLRAAVGAARAAAGSVPVTVDVLVVGDVVGTSPGGATGAGPVPGPAAAPPAVVRPPADPVH